MDEEDSLLLFEDEEEENTLEESETWVLLVVDDEEQIHRATRFALSDFQFEKRALTILSAYSSKEAQEVLHKRDDVACILLDVVMETDNAGLALVNIIRDQLHNRRVRIILRTGQPGHTVESEVIQAYDINDYKNKSELTQERLFTTLTSALRSYGQIQTLEFHEECLKRIVTYASRLSVRESLTTIAEDALKEMVNFLKGEGGLIAFRGALPHVLAQRGTSATPVERLSTLPLEATFQYEETYVLFCLPFRSAQKALVGYVEGYKAASPNMFHALMLSVAAALENAYLFHETERVAFQDSLTGLANRAFFFNALQKTMNSTGKGLVFLLDISSFQTINDGLGPETGDTLLQALASRLLKVCPKEGILARTGSDVFALLLPHHEEEEVLEESTRNLANVTELPFEFSPYEIEVRINLGCARISEAVEGEAAQHIFRNADIALKEAKKSKEHTRLYTPSMNDHLKRRLKIIHLLREHLDHERMHIMYQPKIRLSDGKICSVEALVRWPEGTETDSSPGEFIPAAEESGLIGPLGDWVLEKACQESLVWAASGWALPVAVNVSTRQLYDTHFQEHVQKTLEETGMPKGDLHLEVTESDVLELENLSVFSALKSLGVGLALDDFGTQYSSFRRLREIPFDFLKIDQSFLRKLTSSSDDHAIVALLVRLGHDLGLSVIAEGVETKEQADLLRTMGCDEGQGFFFSRPLSSSALIAHLKGHSPS